MEESSVIRSSSAGDNRRFEYSELPVKPPTIRLLATHRLNDEGVLECSLEDALVDELPQSVALSYTWGTEKASHEISLNGLKFMIRPNLYDFLVTVAVRSLQGQRLFVDAICIDQSNIEEKARQIPLMREIYGRTSRVIAWLGPADKVLSDTYVKNREPSNEKESDNAVSSRKFQDVMRLLNDCTDTQDISADRASQIVRQFHDSGTLFDLKTPGGFSFSYESPFWERVWIVQEIILAQKLTIQIGEYLIDPDNYLLGTEEQPAFPFLDVDVTLLGGFPIDSRRKLIRNLLSSRDEWRRRVEKEGGVELYEIFLRFGFQKATEPLDKIFGFLGLAKTQVQPDYRLNPLEVYAYVLIEGLQQFQPSSSAGKDLVTLIMFHYACLSSFQYSAAQLAIAVITHRAMIRCSVPLSVRMFVIALTLFCEQIGTAWAENSRRSFIGLCTNVVEAVWIFFRSFVIYTSLCTCFYYFRIHDCELSTPGDAKVRYSELVAFVDATCNLVEHELPPRPRGLFTRNMTSATNSDGVLAPKTVLLGLVALILASMLAKTFWH